MSTIYPKLMVKQFSSGHQKSMISSSFERVGPSIVRWIFGMISTFLSCIFDLVRLSIAKSIVNEQK